MEQLILKYLNFFGALALVYFAVRMGSYCLGSLLGGQWRGDDDSELLRGRSPREIFFWGLLGSGLERDPRNTTFAILEFANSRMLSLRESLIALRGAVVGDSYLLWVAAAFLWFVPSLQHSFSIAAMLSCAAMLVYCIRPSNKWLFYGVIALSLMMISVSMTNYALSDIALLESAKGGGVLASVWRYTASSVGYTFFVGVLMGLLIGKISASASFVAIVALVLSYTGFGVSLSLGMISAAPLGVLFSVVGVASRANSTSQRAFALHSLTLFVVIIIAGVLNWSLYYGVIDRLIPYVAVPLAYWVVTIILPSVAWRVVRPASRVVCRLIPQRTCKAQRLCSLGETPSLYSGFSLTLLESQRDKGFARTHKILSFLVQVFNSQSPNEVEHNAGRIAKYLELSSNAKDEIVDYIQQLDTRSWSPRAKGRVIAVHNDVMNLEYMGASLRTISELLGEMWSEKSDELKGTVVSFSQSQKQILGELFNDIDTIYKLYLLDKKTEQTPEQTQIEDALGKIKNAQELYYVYHNAKMLEILSRGREVLRLIYKLKGNFPTKK